VIKYITRKLLENMNGMEFDSWMPTVIGINELAYSSCTSVFLIKMFVLFYRVTGEGLLLLAVINTDW